MPHPQNVSGAGPHACFGSHLAPMVATIAWTALFTRHPAVRLAGPLLERRPSLVCNGRERLDVLV